MTRNIKDKTRKEMNRKEKQSEEKNEIWCQKRIHNYRSHWTTKQQIKFKWNPIEWNFEVSVPWIQWQQWFVLIVKSDHLSFVIHFVVIVVGARWPVALWSIVRFSLFYNHNGNGKQKPKQQIFYWPINRLCRAHRKKISFSILIFTLLEQPRLQWLQQQLLLFGLVLWMNFCATCLIN